MAKPKQGRRMVRQNWQLFFQLFHKVSKRSDRGYMKIF